jgi:hypothetical protein
LLRGRVNNGVGGGYLLSSLQVPSGFTSSLPAV